MLADLLVLIENRLRLNVCLLFSGLAAALPRRSGRSLGRRAGKHSKSVRNVVELQLRFGPSAHVSRHSHLPTGRKASRKRISLPKILYFMQRLGGILFRHVRVMRLERRCMRFPRSSVCDFVFIFCSGDLAHELCAVRKSLRGSPSDRRDSFWA